MTTGGRTTPHWTWLIVIVPLVIVVTELSVLIARAIGKLHQ